MDDKKNGDEEWWDEWWNYLLWMDKRPFKDG